MEDGKRSIYVVVAAYNEGSVLGPVLDDLISACPNAQVVVVDDGSTDTTSDVAASRPVRLLRHPINLGQGAALRTGLEYSISRDADVIVTFDADGQMSAGDVPRVCEPLLSGELDVVLGTRFGGISPSGMGGVRRLTLRLGTAFSRLTSHLPVTDTYNGLRAFTRGAAQQIKIEQDRMGHGLEILYEINRLHLRWTEVPVAIRYTEYSMGKGLSSLAAIDIVADLWGARR